jgi:four helix bundle protein
MVEGDGRLTDPDALRFFSIARASAREAQYWIQVAAERALLDPDLAASLLEGIQQASKELNALIAYRRRNAGVRVVKETEADYDSRCQEK